MDFGLSLAVTFGSHFLPESLILILFMDEMWLTVLFADRNPGFMIIQYKVGMYLGFI